MQLWKMRGLSLFGKILVINTLIGSLFVYRMAILPQIPENYIRQVHKLFSDFIWNGKKN